MMAGYSLLDWHVKPGRESEFVEKWREVAASNIVENNSDGWAKLLRDEQDPAHFVSLAEWPDVRAVGQWFASDVFRQRRDQLRDLVESVTPSNFSQEASV
jgi:heme-degrading monooxygenase HmoA